MSTSTASDSAQDVVLELLKEDGPIEAESLHMRCHQRGVRGRALKEAKRALQDSGLVVWEKVYARELGNRGDRYFWRLTSQESIVHTLADRDEKHAETREKARQMVLERKEAMA